MDFSYINLLYKDLAQKRENIQAYCKSVEAKADEIYKSVYEADTFVKQKFNALNQTPDKRMPSTSDLALDSKEKPIEPSISGESLKDLDGSISMAFSEISFLFQKEQKILQNLVISAQEYQDLVNNLFTAWEQVIDKTTGA